MHQNQSPSYYQKRPLKNGDYSIKGFSRTNFQLSANNSPIFISYIGSERKRTKKKLERLSKMKFAALVIESSFDELMIPGMFSKVSPETARQFLISIRIRYYIHIFMNNKRSLCEQFIIDSAIKFFKTMREI